MVIRVKLLAASALFVACPSFAQTVTDNVSRDAQRIQEREQERQRAREDQFRDSQVRPPSGIDVQPELVPDDIAGQCTAIKTVSIKGMSRYPQAAFSDVLGKLTGDCISIVEINAALRAITNRYVSDGYVTSRAVVGPQSLKDGVLDLIVVEGQVAEVISPDGYGAGALGSAFAGVKNSQLNLRALEQGVDQLSRLPSAEPTIDIAPAALPGTSAVLVKRKSVDQPVRPSLSFDNDGSASTGRWQSTLAVDADNVLGIADFWSVYYSRDVEADRLRGSEGVGGFVSVPRGYWTFSASAGLFRYNSVLAGNGQAFANDGRSWNGSLTIDRLLYRDSKTKVSVAGVLGVADTLNRIQGIRLRTSSYRQTTGSINARVQRKLGAGLIALDLGMSRGLNILGANAADTGPGGASILSRRLTAALSFQTRTKSLGIPVDYTAIIRGQAALDPVFSSGRFSLGGSSTVRGFRDDGISGRYGLFTRHQIGFPLLTAFKGKKAAETGFLGFIGYDGGGIISHNKDRFERGYLHSSTLGLRVQNPRFQAEVMASAPLSAPSFIRHKRVELAASFRVLF